MGERQQQDRRKDVAEIQQELEEIQDELNDLLEIEDEGEQHE